MNGSGKPAVSAVIVAWNSAAHIGACLASLRAARDEASGELEIIVVDNASRDGTPALVRERFPDVRVMATHRNLGFAAAANLGLAAARAETLLLLNPDAALESGALSALCARLNGAAGLGCVGPVYVDPDGRHAERPGRAFPTVGVALADGTLLERWLRSSAVLRRYYRDGVPDHVAPDWLHGACLCLRAGAIRAVGGFDAGYFMYAEELDLMHALRAAGWTCAIEPSARVRHLGGGSADRDLVAREQNFFRSRYRLAVKIWGRPFAAYLRVFVALTDEVRLAEEALKLLLRPGRRARFANLRRIARVTLWQWLGWRR